MDDQDKSKSVVVIKDTLDYSISQYDYNSISFDSLTTSNNSLETIRTFSVNTVDSWNTITLDGNNQEWAKEWKLAEELAEIARAAKHNPALQTAIERVRMLYYLSKDDKDGQG